MRLPTRISRILPVLVILLLSCSDGGGPTDPVSEDVTVTIQVQRTDKLAEKARLGADRGKATLEDAATGTSLGTATVSIDTTATVWTIPVSLPRESAGNTAVPVIELINLSSRPEWSGKGKDFEPEQGDPPPVEVFPGPPENLEVTGVTITSEAPTILEGDSVGLEATVEGGVEGTAVVWSSLDAAVASVDQESGMVRGVLPGVTSVEAAAGQHADTLEVTIEARVVAVEVTPAADTLGVIGDTLRFSARALDARDDEMDGVEFAWSSSDATVAEVDETGLVTSRDFGAARITASVEGIEGGADLTVEEPTLPEGVTRQWVGGAPADPTEWGVADNWYPSGVPTEADTVLVGAEVVNQPQVTQTQRVGGVIVAEGATVELVYQALEVTGYVQAEGAITGSTLRMVGAGATLGGNVEIVWVDQPMSLAGDAMIDHIFIKGGSVTVGPHALRAAELWVPSFGGALVMDDPASVVSVTDSLDIRDDGHVLTAGRLEVGGYFYAASYTFEASGTHLTVLNGDGYQYVWTGGRSPNNRTNPLHDLEISSTADSLAVYMNARGDLTVTTPVRLVGGGLAADGEVSAVPGSEIATDELWIGGPSGTQLIEGTLAPGELVMTGTDQLITVGANTSYTHVTLQDGGSAAFAGDVSLAGDVRLNGSLTLAGTTTVAGDVTLSRGNGPQLVVGPHTLSAGGDLTVSRYGGDLVMDDPAAVVTVAGSVNLWNGSANVFTAGRLEVGGDFFADTYTYQASGTHLTVFNGEAHQDVWLRGRFGVPSDNSFQDVEIGNSSDSLTVQGYAVGDVSVTTPVRLVGGGPAAAGEVSAVPGSEIAADQLWIGGPSGTQLIEGTLAPGELVMTGTGQLITVGPNASYTDVTIRDGGTAMFAGDVTLAGELFLNTGSLTLGGVTAVAGDVVLGRGTDHSLTVGPHSLSVTGNLEAPGDYSSILVMDDPASVVTVAGSVLFSGSTNVFTAGRLEVGGDFDAHSLSVEASGTHLTVLNGVGPQAVYLQSSSFQDLELRNTDTVTGVTFSGPVSGNLSHTSGIWNVELNTTTTLQGDLTLSSGVTLNNDGTVEYGGTFTDNGATINGNAPQPISP